MTIEQLKQVMPPPPEPVFPGSKKEWQAFEKRVGLKFPDEYFIVIHEYGSGRFLSGEVKVINPFDSDSEGFAERELERFRASRLECPLPFPDVGIHPFGFDSNGTTFFWKTDGPPNEWEIVIENGAYWASFKHTLTGFLVLLASNGLDVDRRKILGVFEGEATFEPQKLPRRTRKSKAN